MRISGTQEVTKVNANGQRVFQQRVGEQDVTFNDADIIVTWTKNNDSTGSRVVTFDFGQVLQKIIVHDRQGDNIKYLKEYKNVSGFTKNLSTNEDGNGVSMGSSNNSIFLSNLNIISITTTTNNLNAMPAARIVFTKKFPQLKLLHHGIDGNGVGLQYNEIDQTWIDNLPALRSLKISGLRSAETDFVKIKQLPLKWLALYGLALNQAVNNLCSYLPSTLEYFHLKINGNQTIDLKDFFTGGRKGLTILNGYNSIQYNSTLLYTGGAIFPSIIDEDPEMRIEWFFNQSGVTNKLTPVALARFIVDFANQVTAVNTYYKRMRFGSVVPDSSYTDNSQPLFKTYTAAYNHIVSTLKISIQTN